MVLSIIVFLLVAWIQAKKKFVPNANQLIEEAQAVVAQTEELRSTQIRQIKNCSK